MQLDELTANFKLRSRYSVSFYGDIELYLIDALRITGTPR